MLLDVARFELRYLVRSPLLWVTAAATFAFYFISVSTSMEIGSEGGLLENAAYATLQNYMAASIVYVFVTTAFVANAVIRDDETGFGPIVRSTRLTKVEYLLGRFAGAFVVAALCLMLVSLAIWLGTLMPWTDPTTVGLNRLIDHLYGYFLVALPNVLVHSAVFFALATITRSMMATYLGVIAFLSGYFVMQGAFDDRPHLETAVALADPFGMRALTDATRYWTVAERNVTLPDFTGALLFNRLLWIGVAILCLALAHAVYRFADQGMSKRERKRQKIAEPEGAAVAATSLPSPRHGTAARRAMLWMRTRFEAKQVVLSPAFPVLMTRGMFTTLISLTTQRDPDGQPTYPTTLSMIPELENGMFVMPLIVAMYYAGELVWRERDRRMHEIVDAAPMPSWVYVVSKTLAMALVLWAILMTSVVASVITQLSLSFTDLEIGKYLLWYVLPGTWDLLLLAALAVFVQAVSPHKAVGWGVMVLFYYWQQQNAFIPHNLLDYGGTPDMPLSDMNGAGSFWIGAWTFRVYWGAFAVLLLVAAHVRWRRGTAPRVPRVVVGAALLTFVATGAYAFYNTNVLNAYQWPNAGEATAVELERRYGKYMDLPQPVIAAMTLDVALHPEERRAVSKGQYRLRNNTAHPMPDVHVRVAGDHLEVISATVDGGRLVLSDAKHGYRIYRFDRPMQLGEERVLS